MRPRYLAIGCLVAAAATVGACDAAGPREELAHLQIAADSVPCNASPWGRNKCLQARELVGGDAWTAWGIFYFSIDGFEHEPGFVYDLRVARREVRNPPADGSSIAYRLVELISTVPATP